MGRKGHGKFYKPAEFHGKLGTPAGPFSAYSSLILKGTAKKRQFIYFKHSRPKLTNQSTTPREPASHGEKKAKSKEDAR